MRITYVTEDTELWGGIAVVFQHLELLSEAGHDAFLTTPASRPDWYPLKVPVNTIRSFLDPSAFPMADILVSTSWRTIGPVMESKKGIPVHLCQGYEGALEEIVHLKDGIDQAHSLKIPKLTVSRHLETFLKERFRSETYYVGQMLNRGIFYPNRDPLAKLLKIRPKPLIILVVGPFEGNYKNIPTTLQGIILAKQQLKGPLQLIRVSQFPLSGEEEGIIKPDVYHCRVPYMGMGDIYRASDVLISMSTDAEGFGLPALEAMACGVPAILSKIRSHLGFADPQDYAIFVESVPEAVSEAILHLCEDAKMRRKLIKKGLSVARKFTREALLLKLTTAFEKIIAHEGEKVYHPSQSGGYL
ncbi:MAG: glycosyltransferase family 4 protein [Deltaproteobacteria bacterium]|nr:glycosyltransferase family 4 protein [Deltaproteobacteria bacterium]